MKTGAVVSCEGYFGGVVEVMGKGRGKRGSLPTAEDIATEICPLVRSMMGLSRLSGL